MLIPNSGHSEARDVGSSNAFKVETAGGNRGTGFFVTPNIFITACHVVMERQEGSYRAQKDINLYVDGDPRVSQYIDEGNILAYDWFEDWAILYVDSPQPNRKIWSLVDLSDASHTQWSTFGFGVEEGTAISGDITSTNIERHYETIEQGLVPLQRFQLFAQHMGAWNGQSAPGFSGAPVVVQGRVAGVIVSQLGVERTRVDGGTLFAVPARDIVSGAQKTQANSHQLDAIRTIEIAPLAKAHVTPQPGPQLRPPAVHTELPDRDRGPYPRLGRYEHPKLFTGRDVEQGKVKQELLKEQTHILCLSATSGVGKSSFLEAALKPSLESSGSTVYLDEAPEVGNLRYKISEALFENCSEADKQSFGELLRRVVGAPQRQPVVIILDQFESCWLKEVGSERSSNHAQDSSGGLSPQPNYDSPLWVLGQMLIETAGLPRPRPCRWVFSYRKEFHWDVMQWLEQIPTSDKNKTADLTPFARRFELYPLGSAYNTYESRLTSVSTAEAEKLFRTAILRPLELKNTDGTPYFDLRMDNVTLERIVQQFSQARTRDPEAPLTPELQAVLGQLLDDAVQKRRDKLEIPADIPDDDLFHKALLRYVASVFESSFARREERTMVFQLLERLTTINRNKSSMVTGDGVRSEGLSSLEIKEDFGEVGMRLLQVLQRREVWLIVREEHDQNAKYTLTHDVLADLVARISNDRGERSKLGLDESLLSLNRKLNEYGDERTPLLELPVGIASEIRRKRDKLVWSANARAWWEEVENPSSQGVVTQFLRKIGSNIYHLVGSVDPLSAALFFISVVFIWLAYGVLLGVQSIPYEVDGRKYDVGLFPTSVHWWFNLLFLFPFYLALILVHHRRIENFMQLNATHKNGRERWINYLGITLSFTALFAVLAALVDLAYWYKVAFQPLIANTMAEAEKSKLLKYDWSIGVLLLKQNELSTRVYNFVLSAGACGLQIFMHFMFLYDFAVRFGFLSFLGSSSRVELQPKPRREARRQVWNIVVVSGMSMFLAQMGLLLTRIMDFYHHRGTVEDGRAIPYIWKILTSSSWPSQVFFDSSLSVIVGTAIWSVWAITVLHTRDTMAEGVRADEDLMDLNIVMWIGRVAVIILVGFLVLQTVPVLLPMGMLALTLLGVFYLKGALKLQDTAETA